jgi:hypothetical protein
MSRDVLIPIADDDAGHARLLQRSLTCAALPNPIRRFEDGQQVLDFFPGGDAAGNSFEDGRNETRHVGGTL